MGESARRKLSYEEYLGFERELDRKHELIDGEVFAMAGGTITHGVLAARVNGAIMRTLGPMGCTVGSSDVKVFIPAHDRTTYADGLVLCGPWERAPHDRNAVTNPTVLVEVISESTEAEDRGGKFHAYASLASLREYLLVDQYERRIEVFRRNDDGTWTLLAHGPGGTVQLASIGASFALDEVYAGVELERRTRSLRALTPP